MLDPILYDLLDPAVKRVPSITKINGKQLQGFFYERPFDQTYVNHLLETLLSVVKFGGQGFVKVARATLVQRSHHPELVERVQSGMLHCHFFFNPLIGWLSLVGLTDPDATYQDILLEVLTRCVLELDV